MPTSDCSVDDYRAWQAKLLDAETVESVAAVGATAACNVLPASGAAVYVTEFNGKSFRLAGSSGLDSLDDTDIDSGPLRDTYETGQPRDIDGNSWQTRPELGAFADADTVRLEPLSSPGVLAVATRSTPSALALALVRDGIDGALARVSHQSARRTLERERRDCLRTLETEREREKVLENVVRTTVEAESQAELERLVCERLVSLDDVAFAWMGEYDPEANTFAPSTWAGRENGYIDSVGRLQSEPVSEFFRRIATADDGVTTIDHVTRSELPDPVAGAAHERGFESIAFVPVVHAGTVHGVLGLYGTEIARFDDSLANALEAAGRLVGKAVSTMNRERALLSDAVIEAEFRVSGDELVTCWISSELDCEVRFESMLLVSDGSTRTFLSIFGADPDEVRTAAPEHERIRSLTHITDRPEGSLFEVRLEDTMVEYLAARDIVLTSLKATDGVVHASVELPIDADLRAFVEEVQSTYPNADLVARHERERSSETVPEVRARFQKRLTDRQHEVLQVAYHSGYFDWPRATDGETLADTLDIAQSTMLQHLRTAERKLLTEILEAQRSIYSQGK